MKPRHPLSRQMRRRPASQPVPHEKPALSRQMKRRNRLNRLGLCAQCGREPRVQKLTIGVRCFKRIRRWQQKREGHKPWKPGRMGRPVKYL